MSSFQIDTLQSLEKITVDDVEYVVADLPTHLQELVRMYDGFRQELHETRLSTQYELIKSEAAVQQCGQLIAAGVQSMNKEAEDSEKVEQQVEEKVGSTATVKPIESTVQ